MPLIVIDGPEKAGKSTLAAALAVGHGARVRAFRGPARPDDREYAAALAEDAVDVAQGRLVVYDRSWASEVVYGTLLGQRRRLGSDWWQAEWLYGRAPAASGLRVMLLGPDAGTLRGRRDATDLNVEPDEERHGFGAYAEAAGWLTLTEVNTAREVASLAQMASAVSNLAARRAAMPPYWAGPPDASVVFVGQDRVTRTTGVGAWLPFSSRLTTEVARRLTRFQSLQCGWTNAAECPPSALVGRELVVTCGEAAREWYDRTGLPYLADAPLCLALPHPAWLYRYYNLLTRAAKPGATRRLRVAVGRVMRP